MDIVYTVILTIVILSTVRTIIILVSKENDTVIEICGFGIVGCMIWFVLKTGEKIYKYFKYHFNKRSIFEDKNGNQFICKTRDCNDVCWNEHYKLVKRYAPKTEWNGLPEIQKKIIEKCKRNCDNCKYDKECLCEFPYNKIKCKHDEFGTVTEFNKFTKIIKWRI